MGTLVCSKCGKTGLYWKNLAGILYPPYTYCPHCGGTNCQQIIDEDMIEEGMYVSDKCQFCNTCGPKAEPFLCAECRERIFEWINTKGWSILQVEERKQGSIYFGVGGHDGVSAY